MTKEEVFKLLVLIESVYPNCVTKNEMVLHWFRQAPYLDFQSLKESLNHHIRESPYPPALKDLLEGREILKHDANQNGIIGFMQKPVSSWIKEYSIR